MTQAFERSIDRLRVTLNYDVEPAVGDIVEMIAGRKVQKLTTGIPVGRVSNVRSSLKECTVDTPFSRLTKYVCGEDTAIGWFKFAAVNKVYQVASASVARHDGTATGPVTVVLDTSDKVKVKFDGTSTTVTLTAGSRTMAQIAAELNAALVGCRAEVDAAGNLNLVGTQIGKTVEIEAVANNAYTLLGWTAAIYYPTNASDDPSAIRGLIIVPADADDEAEVLEY